MAVRESRLFRPLIDGYAMARRAVADIEAVREAIAESRSTFRAKADALEAALLELRKALADQGSVLRGLQHDLAAQRPALSEGRQALDEQQAALRGLQRDLVAQREEATRRAAEADAKLLGLQAGLDTANAALGEARDATARAAEAAAARPAEPAYFGLHELDRKLEAYLDQDGGFFVEVGANDGVAQSNTLHFERHRRWTGILVEPTPQNFLKCLENRAASTRVVCCGCTSFDYRERFVEIAFSNLMSTPVGLETDIVDPLAHAEEGRRFLASSDRVFSFGALARTMNDVLLEAGAPATIDLFSLDVEGSEIEVLKGIDHDRFRFRYLCVECRDLPKMAAYLRAQGYALIDQLSHHDYLFRCERSAAAADRGPSPAA